MHFRILNMTATSVFLTALKCTKFVFCQVEPRTPLGSLQRFPRDPGWFKGALIYLKNRKQFANILVAIAICHMMASDVY